jgi:hypothetical protein
MSTAEFKLRQAIMGQSANEADPGFPPQFRPKTVFGAPSSARPEVRCGSRHRRRRPPGRSRR